MEKEPPQGPPLRTSTPVYNPPVAPVFPRSAVATKGKISEFPIPFPFALLWTLIACALASQIEVSEGEHGGMRS